MVVPGWGACAACDGAGTAGLAAGAATGGVTGACSEANTPLPEADSTPSTIASRATQEQADFCWSKRIASLQLQERRSLHGRESKIWAGCVLLHQGGEGEGGVSEMYTSRPDLGFRWSSFTGLDVHAPNKCCPRDSPAVQLAGLHHRRPVHRHQSAGRVACGGAGALRADRRQHHARPGSGGIPAHWAALVRRLPEALFRMAQARRARPVHLRRQPRRRGTAQALGRGIEASAARGQRPLGRRSPPRRCRRRRRRPG